MVEVINDEYMVCTDCLMYIANGDVSGLDYYYNEVEAAERLKAIYAGEDAAGGYIVCGDSEKDLEFSHRSCDNCQSGLADGLHHCVVLGEDNA